MSKYRLLKDAPKAKIGDIFRYNGGEDPCYINHNNVKYHYNTVVDNPDWFEKITIAPPSKTYTEQEVLRLEEKAFNSGRAGAYWMDNVNHEYKSFSDYKSSKE